MGVSLISECLFILNWAKERYGFKHAAISGALTRIFSIICSIEPIEYAFRIIAEPFVPPQQTGKVCEEVQPLLILD